MLYLITLWVGWGSLKSPLLMRCCNMQSCYAQQGIMMGLPRLSFSYLCIYKIVSSKSLGYVINAIHWSVLVSWVMS